MSEHAHVWRQRAHQILVDILPLEQVIESSLGIQLDTCFVGLPLAPPIPAIAAEHEHGDLA